MRRGAQRMSTVGVLATCLVALVGGITELDCVSAPIALVVVAGAFGAGASTATLVAQRRSSRTVDASRAGSAGS